MLAYYHVIDCISFYCGWHLSTWARGNGGAQCINITDGLRLTRPERCRDPCTLFPTLSENDAITSTEAGMNSCQTGVWWDASLSRGGAEGGRHPQRRIRNVASFSLIASSENFIRLPIPTSPERTAHAMRRLRPISERRFILATHWSVASAGQ